MRKIAALLAGVVLASSARATPLARYTLSLNESPSGTVQPGQFAIYATVSQGDNWGLSGFAVDLLAPGEIGGPAGLTLINRTPLGTFDVDPNDPNFNPATTYETRLIGFSTAHLVNQSRGIVTGIDEFIGPEKILMRGVGQVAHDMNDFRPAPDTSSGVPVSYGNYAPRAAESDSVIGTPFNRAGILELPEGTIRLASGTYTVGGAVPAFEVGSGNNRVGVWKLNSSNNASELAQLSFCTRDFAAGEFGQVAEGCAVPEPGFVGFMLMGASLLARRKRLEMFYYSQ